MLAAGVVAAAHATGVALAQDGFTHTRVARGLTNPTAMAFAPDGRLFVTEQGGNLRVIKGGKLLPEPFVSLVVDSRGERGLLGVAFDPDFASNRHVYVYYTATTPTFHNRVSRFTADGDLAVPGSERILLELDELTRAQNHNGGALHFGPDRKLYVGVGENSHGRNSQTLENLLGKMLRINRDGSIPTDNPFYGAAVGKNRAIWAMGLRNPFSFAIQRGTGKIFINDVGQDTWEEINRGAAGANYGWPIYEGPESDPRYQGPLYAYTHSMGCAITGAAFYDPEVVQFPRSYVGDYFFADYCAGQIRRYDVGTGSVSVFTRRLENPVDLQVSRTGLLHYVIRGTYANEGEVWRVSYTGAANRAPTADASADPPYGPLPLTVTLDAMGSFDPDGDPLTYEWSFGDGTPGAFGRTVTHTYASRGKFFATVRVRDGQGNVGSAQVRIDPGHTAPAVNLISPGTNLRFRVDQVVRLRAAATDERGRTLPDEALSWTIYLHHEDHVHPFLGPRPGNDIPVTMPPPDGLTATTTSYLRVLLTATDSRGLARTVARRLLPNTVDVTFRTDPGGLELRLKGEPFAAPRTFTSWEGYGLDVNAPDQTDGSGRSWEFVSWSDGGAQRHAVVTPSSATTYTARFQQVP